MRQPELAKKNPKRMFLSASDGGYFDRVFSSDLTAEKFVAAHRLAECVDDYVRKFMSRKRRKERAGNWQQDYESLLGKALVDAHSDVIDQVIPQSAVFLTAMVFDSVVNNQGKGVDVVIAEIQDDTGILNGLVCDLVETAKSDPSTSKSWPTLLKSQGFFDKVSAFVKAKTGAPKDAACPSRRAKPVSDAIN